MFRDSHAQFKTARKLMQQAAWLRSGKRLVLVAPTQGQADNHRERLLELAPGCDGLVEARGMPQRASIREDIYVDEIVIDGLIYEQPMFRELFEPVPAHPTYGQAPIEALFNELGVPRELYTPTPTPMTQQQRPLDPEQLFSYHRPSPENVAKIQRLRDAHKALASLILELVPGCAEQTIALRKLHECSMHANYALVKNDAPEAP